MERGERGEQRSRETVGIRIRREEELPQDSKESLEAVFGAVSNVAVTPFD